MQHCILKKYIETQKLRFRFTLSSFFLFSPLLSVSAVVYGSPLTPLISNLHLHTPPLLLLQPTPSFLHPEYNARIRGISNSMSFQSEHHRSYSFSGLSLSRCSISPSVLHSLLFSFYISVILFCILPGSFFYLFFIWNN